MHNKNTKNNKFVRDDTRKCFFPLSLACVSMTLTYTTYRAPARKLRRARPAAARGACGAAPAAPNPKLKVSGLFLQKTTETKNQKDEKNRQETNDQMHSSAYRSTRLHQFIYACTHTAARVRAREMQWMLSLRTPCFLVWVNMCSIGVFF